MSTKIFIDGEHGTTGLQIIDRLSARSDIELISIAHKDRRDQDVRKAESREADIAISPRIPPGFLGKPYAKVDMHAVAANTHPLAQRNSVTEDQLKLTRQIVVRDSGLYRKQDGGWLGAEQRWTV